MHTYLINLKKVIDPLDLDEIQNYKVDIDCFMEDEIRHSCIDYVGDEYEQIDTSVLANAYENGVFDLIQKDEKYNLNHINLAHSGEFLIIS